MNLNIVQVNEGLDTNAVSFLTMYVQVNFILLNSAMVLLSKAAILWAVTNWQRKEPVAIGVKEVHRHRSNPGVEFNH